MTAQGQMKSREQVEAALKRAYVSVEGLRGELAVTGALTIALLHWVLQTHPTGTGEKEGKAMLAILEPNRN